MTLRIAAALTISASQLGCGGIWVPRPRYSRNTGTPVPISHEPPPARVEDLPPRPTGASAWVDGEWSWNHRRWAWSPGRWVAPPDGATYSPWATVRDRTGALFFAPAQWRDAHGAPIPPPRALATAQVQSGAVVDAEGEMERTTLTGEE
jgi:hypothetical protein